MITITVNIYRYLSTAPLGLQAILPYYDSIVFVDICKSGQAPLEGMIPRFQHDKLLPGAHWRSVAATRAYNPLSSYVNFVNSSDIIDALKSLLSEK